MNMKIQHNKIYEKQPKHFQEGILQAYIKKQEKS